MRILYLTQWFEPEPNIVKGIPFVQALQAAGHQVTVVTGLPNYPTGKIYDGYRLRLLQRETIDGVRIIRLPLYPNHGTSTVGRSLNFLSFFLAALTYCLLRRQRFDMAYVYQPPITVALAAALAGLLRPLPFVLDVQDLWPDTIGATGMRGASLIVSLLAPLCSFVYRRSNLILTQSAGMKRKLIQRSVPAEKIAVVRNWADLAELPHSLHIEGRRGAPFTIVYAGNLGRAQGLDTLIAAATLVQRRSADIRIKVYGDGVDATLLREQAEALGLDNLTFEGRRPKAEIVDILRAADALVLCMAKDPLFEITIPSKTQFYLALGKPIIAAIGGEGAELLDRSGAALVTAPGNSDTLASALCQMAGLDSQKLTEMGAQGRRFYEQHLAFEQGIARTLGAIDGAFQPRFRPEQAAAA